jgi:hypothetical protein
LPELKTEEGVALGSKIMELVSKTIIYINENVNKI